MSPFQTPAPAEGIPEWLKVRSAAEPFGSSMLNDHTGFDLKWFWVGLSVRVVASFLRSTLVAQRALMLLVVLRRTGMTTPEKLKDLESRTAQDLTLPQTKSEPESPAGADYAQLLC